MAFLDENGLAELWRITNEWGLKDATKIAYGLETSAVPDDAFVSLNNRLNLIAYNLAGVRVTVKTPSGAPLVGVQIGGIANLDGSVVITNERGIAYGYAQEGSVTLKISGYADLEDCSHTLTVQKGLEYAHAFTTNTRNFLKLLDTQNVMFSGNVSSLDITCVGGGGGGSGNITASNLSGAGGGGGYCEVHNGVSFEHNTMYTATIGAGGTAGKDTWNLNSGYPSGGAGGKTSFIGITANGGSGGRGYRVNNYSTEYTYGGEGNGKGGDGCRHTGATERSPAGEDGSVYGFSSYTEEVLYGGGGGAGGIYWYDNKNRAGGAGGKSFGAAGSNNAAANAPAAGTGGGGGGAGFYNDGENGSFYASSRGGSGCVAMRMHLKVS